MSFTKNSWVRICWVLILISLFAFDTMAQYSKYIIQLTNKQNNTYNLSNPAQFLSPRAVNRRLKYNIPYDSTDLPVSQPYIDSISLVSNVNILSTSKWLNRVLIQTTDPTALTTIQSFSFVSSVVSIAPKIINADDEKFEEYIEPLYKNSSQRIGSNSFNYGNTYNQIHIHEGEFLHNKGFTGQNMQIAVLDAGFLQYKNLTAFDSAKIGGRLLGEKDFVNFDNSTDEDDAHGMYCLSTMAANWPGKMVGTAPHANYWLIRTENAPTEYPIEELNWVIGAEFADSAGADLISSSLGYTTFDDVSFNHNYSELYKNMATVSKGASLAANKGMIVMNSAGNEGNSSWRYIAFPADSDSVCTVGAINSQGSIASFSSKGYPGKIKPNIVSVGVSTVVAGLNNQPSSGNGTSFSNPNVAGLIACLWQAFPNLNNMQLLNAVYRSSNQYTTPNANYGYGVPNFRIAYRTIKHDQNVALYGNEWLWATPNPFDIKIDVKFIGRTDGNAVLYLKNAAGEVLAKQNFTTEQEEVYNYTFENLGGYPAGYYKVEFTDNSTTRTIELQKGNIFDKDWLIASPVPFRNTLFINLKSPDAGEISLRMITENGSVVKVFNSTVTVNEIRSINWNLNELSAGVYYLQYISNERKRLIKVMKY